MATPRVPFKITIVTLFVALTLGLSGVVLYVNYERNSEASVSAADKLLEQAAGRIVVAAERLIEPPLALTQLTALMPGVDAPLDAGAEHPLAPILFAFLERYPQVTAAYIGNARGEFYRIASLQSLREVPRAHLDAPPQAAFAVQTISVEGGRRVERWRFLDAAKRDIGTREAREASYDPRKRSWYVAARDSADTVATDYYIFASAPTIGLTVARRVGDDSGAVFGADLTLTSISRYLAMVRSSQLFGTGHAEIAMFNLDGRLLAHSDHAAYERLLDAEATPRMPQVGDVGAGVMASVQADYRAGAPPQRRVTGANGVSWLAYVSPLAPAYGAGSFLAVAVPMDDILGPLARNARDSLLVSAAVVLAFLPLVYFAAGAVSAPLARLRREIAGLRNLELVATPPVDSSIAEIQDLGRALATAKLMLAAFAKYVPKNLVRQIVGSGDAPRLGGERRPLTVFFSDVRDFTTISEQVPPERLMEFTSEYLEGLVNVILENRGTVDKFVGDQIMAYWNAPMPNPDHASDGCRAILRCRDWSNERNGAWAREGHPVLYTRFALHLGDAIVGNVGSSDRMDYTVVGATINLGSRIEGLNKIYGTQVLITQAVVDAIGRTFVHRPVDRVLPKGAVHPLDVHELLGVHPHAQDAPDLRVTPQTVARCAAWRAFYDICARRDWRAAAAALAEFRARHGDDGLTKIYAERLRRFAAEPPAADWDRVVRYTEK